MVKTFHCAFMEAETFKSNIVSMNIK